MRRSGRLGYGANRSRRRAFLSHARGDVVWPTARRLHEALAGQVLTRSDFRVPRFATVDLTGQLVTEVVARGKHLLIRTAGGADRAHPPEDGRLLAGPRGRPGGRPAESFKLRLMLANAHWQAVGYLLGWTEVIPHRRRGHRWSGTSAPTCSARTGTGPGGPPPARPGPGRRRGAARPAQPGRDRQRLHVARCCSCGASTRGGRSEIDNLPAAGRPRPPAARRQQGPARACHHRRHQARQGELGLRARGPALPAVRHPDQEGRAGGAGRGADAVPRSNCQA